MVSNQTKRQIENLRIEIEQANEAYYVEENSSMSDFEYDKKFRELIDLEKKYPELISENSPTQRIGALPAENFNQVQHLTPMLSLSNVFNYEELKEWIERNSKTIGVNIFPIMCELKIDGLAVSVKYINGFLSEASTRGNGVTGEEITNNVKTIRSLPLRINSLDPLEFRGEIYFPNSKFNQFNNQRESEGLRIYSNPRNAASGSVRQLDPSETSKRPINIFFYSLLNGQGSELLDSQSKALDKIKDLGLRTEKNYKKINSFEELLEFIEYWSSNRSSLDYGTDGIVIKIDNVNYQKKLGSTGRIPRWATAFKFPPEVVETTIKKINFNVGRTGVLTPWAELEPVIIDGVTISRATLHNKDEIERKDLREKDLIELQRAGEVIPQILRISKNNKREKDSKKFQFPQNCLPPCNSILFVDPNEVSIMCTNSSCENKFERLLQYFASKNCMDIEGLGNKICSILFKNNIIKSLDDIYNLKNHINELNQIEGFGDKSINKLLLSIENSKNKNFSRLLTSFGIDGVGSEIAELISEKINNLEELNNKIKNLENLREILIDIDGIGPIVAENFIRWSMDENNRILISKFIEIGIGKENEKNNQKSNLFEKKSFVITGSFIDIKRNELEILLKENGGKVTNKISNKTDYLILGENPGSKLLEAQDKNVTIINFSQLKSLIEEGILPNG